MSGFSGVEFFAWGAKREIKKMSPHFKKLVTFPATCDIGTGMDGRRTVHSVFHPANIFQNFDPEIFCGGSKSIFHIWRHTIVTPLAKNLRPAKIEDVGSTRNDVAVQTSSMKIGSRDLLGVAGSKNCQKTRFGWVSHLPRKMRF